MVIYEILYTVKQVMEILHISENELWELLNTHRLNHVLICERIMIRGIDLEMYVNQLTSL